MRLTKSNLISYLPAVLLALLPDAHALSLSDRRQAMQHILVSSTSSAASASTLIGGMMALTSDPSSTWAADATTSAAVSTTTKGEEEKESMYAPKFVQEYADFTKTNEGWSYRDVSVGNGSSPTMGDRVVFDWSGYTIGYFGRPFEAKGGPQGGAFDKRDVDYSRTVLGSAEVVKGLECAMRDMKVGGVRQVIVPYGALSYPADDGAHERVGPKPTTFSGQRALNFVLDNPRVDRTLLFNVKLIRVDKPDGNGGFSRGDRV